MKAVPDARCGCMLGSIHDDLLTTLVFYNFVFPALKVVLMGHVMAALEGECDNLLASLLISVPQMIVFLILHLNRV
jgi:hypothetical protein